MVNSQMVQMSMQSPPNKKTPKKKPSPRRADVSPMRTKRAAAINCLNNIKDNPNMK